MKTKSGASWGPTRVKVIDLILEKYFSNDKWRVVFDLDRDSPKFIFVDLVLNKLVLLNVDLDESLGEGFINILEAEVTSIIRHEKIQSLLRDQKS